jgi:hypothetical protein
MNTLIHKLSNRSGDFKTDLFNLTSYTPVDHPYPDLLRYLGLDGADYYVKSYFLNLRAHPDILVEIPGGLEPYPDLPRGTYQVSGAELKSHNDSHVGFTFSPGVWPLPFEVELSHVTDTLGKISFGEKVLRVRCSGSSYLEVDWPEEIKVGGRLYPNNWPSQPIVIFADPVFPWELLASLLPERSDVQDLLRKQGWLGVFHNSGARRRVALVTAALLKCLPN